MYEKFYMNKVWYDLVKKQIHLLTAKYGRKADLVHFKIGELNFELVQNIHTVNHEKQILHPLKKNITFCDFLKSNGGLLIFLKSPFLKNNSNLSDIETVGCYRFVFHVNTYSHQLSRQTLVYRVVIIVVWPTSSYDNWFEAKIMPKHNGLNIF